MAEETAVVATGDVTEPKETAEVSTVAETKVGEVDPQANANEGEPDHEQKRKGGWQRKIEKLERELEVWRDHALKHPTTEQPASPAKPEPAAEFRYDKPEPQAKDFDLGDGTYDVAKYARAMARYELDRDKAESAHQQQQEQRTQAQKQAQAKEAETVKDWRTRNAESIKKYSDFNAALKDAPPVTDVLHEAILESEVGADLAYYFATHEDETERICQLPRWKQAAEVAKLIEKFAPQESAAEEVKEPPPPPVTRAPKPTTPVSKPSATAAPFDPVADAEKLPYKEWAAKRTAQLRK